jgi:uncharacterized surface protein with fasciclin (FAS1) repeats
MKKIKYNLLWIMMIILTALGFNRCEYPYENSRVVEDLAIGEYLEQHSDSFSVFVEILKGTGNMAFLKSYGEYTCFVPTNDAFREYFAGKGLASTTSTNDELVNVVLSMDQDDLSDLVRFSVIKGDTIYSQNFVDGRMDTPTMYGQYLTYSTSYKNGELVEVINKTAVIDQKDIGLINGVIHTLKDVIEPEKLTIAQYIEQLGGYSIFTEALKITGLYDTLNIIHSADHDTIWYTFFATSDAILNADTIYSAADIGAKYATDNIPADSALYLYVAYHILPDQYDFVSDLVSAQAVSTMAPSEVLTVKSSGTSVLINDDTFAGIYEPGYEIDRDASDQTVDNGVIHFMKGNFFVKVRYPFAVFWEVTEQTELKKMTGVFRKASTTLENGQLANISWEPEDLTIDYSYGDVNGAHGHIFDDFLNIYLRPAVVQSITFVTPTLVKGSYKIWVCMRTQSGADVATKNSKFYVYFNGEQTTQILDNRQCYNSGSGYSDGELNLIGLKIYNYDPDAYSASDSTELASVVANGIANNWVANAGRYASEYAGTVVVTETGTQTLQFVAISGGVNAQVYLDQIHFIPADEEQNWPRINWKNGSKVYKEDLEAGILP